jgi:hypothetical protein
MDQSIDDNNRDRQSGIEPDLGGMPAFPAPEFVENAPEIHSVAMADYLWTGSATGLYRTDLQTGATEKITTYGVADIPRALVAYGSTVAFAGPAHNVYLVTQNGRGKIQKTYAPDDLLGLAIAHDRVYFAYNKSDNIWLRYLDAAGKTADVPGNFGTAPIVNSQGLLEIVEYAAPYGDQTLVRIAADGKRTPLDIGTITEAFDIRARVGELVYGIETRPPTKDGDATLTRIIRRKIGAPDFEEQVEPYSATRSYELTQFAVSDNNLLYDYEEAPMVDGKLGTFTASAGFTVADTAPGTAVTAPNGTAFASMNPSGNLVILGRDGLVYFRTDSSEFKNPLYPAPTVAKLKAEPQKTK